jgi:hypothetical protein
MARRKMRGQRSEVLVGVVERGLTTDQATQEVMAAAAD